jgi:hypothetical protein
MENARTWAPTKTKSNNYRYKREEASERQKIFSMEQLQKISQILEGDYPGTGRFLTCMTRKRLSKAYYILNIVYTEQRKTIEGHRR